MYSKVEILKEKILSDIKTGRLAKDHPIPSRFQIMKRYSCSRGTVDKAISGLVNHGYLYGRQGAGTYVGETSDSVPVRQVFLAGDYDLRSYADAETANLASELQKHLPCFLYNVNDIKINLDKMARPGNAVIWVRPPYEQLMVMKYLAHAGVPQLLIGRSYASFDHIVTDAREGIRKGLEWLVGNAGVEVIFITSENNPDSPYIAERQIAFYELAVEMGLNLDGKRIFRMDFKDLKKDLNFLTGKLFSGKKRMKAVFSTHIGAAFPLVSMAESRGWHTGEDFFFLTFDYSSSLCGYRGIGMLRQLWDEMGEKSVEWLARKRKNRNEEFKIRICPELITWENENEGS
jgi:DNA-binding transcriptional regulator YhcF (GntR family)